MINSKLIEIRDRKKAKLNADIKEKINQVTETHKQEGFSPSWQQAKTELDDAQAYGFAYLRDKRLRRNPSGPSDSGYWIDWSHHESELAPSAVIKALEGVPEDKLKQIIADFIVFNRGLIDSTIDFTEAYQKNNGMVRVNSAGTLVNASELQNYFRFVPDKNSEYQPTSKRRSLSHSLNQLFIFIETKCADAMASRQKSGVDTLPATGSATKELIIEECSKHPEESVTELMRRLELMGLSLPSKRTIERYTKPLRQR